jgi:hypothetical protein
MNHRRFVNLTLPQGSFVDVIAGNATGQEISLWLRKEMTHPSS